MSNNTNKLNKIKNDSFTLSFLDFQLEDGKHVVSVERMCFSPDLPPTLKITETGFNRKKLINRLFRKVFR